jgi:hypothetical protein
MTLGAPRSENEIKKKLHNIAKIKPMKKNKDFTLTLNVYATFTLQSSIVEFCLLLLSYIYALVMTYVVLTWNYRTLLSDTV